MQKIECPLCGQHQCVIIDGIERIGDEVRISDKKGYAFCNCYNIFFTDKSNIDKLIYDEGYYEKYNGLENLYEPYFKFIDERSNGGVFAEVGTINDVIMNKAIDNGYSSSYCFDIGKRKTKYHQYIGDFEEIKTSDVGFKVDYFFMSHVFEHFTNPKQTAKMISDLLNDCGKVFIAMPDPGQMCMESPHNWQHLWVREHYILWDMESFIKFMKEYSGLNCIYKERNFFSGSAVSGDYRLVFEK